MTTFAKHGLERDTLVIFTTDNGPWLSCGNHAGSSGPHPEGIGTSWEGGTRVPASCDGRDAFRPAAPATITS